MNYTLDLSEPKKIDIAGIIISFICKKVKKEIYNIKVIKNNVVVFNLKTPVEDFFYTNATIEVNTGDVININLDKEIQGDFSFKALFQAKQKVPNEKKE